MRRVSTGSLPAVAAYGVLKAAAAELLSRRHVDVRQRVRLARRPANCVRLRLVSRPSLSLWADRHEAHDGSSRGALPPRRSSRRSGRRSTSRRCSKGSCGCSRTRAPSTPASSTSSTATGSGSCSAPRRPRTRTSRAASSSSAARGLPGGRSTQAQGGVHPRERARGSAREVRRRSSKRSGSSRSSRSRSSASAAMPIGAITLDTVAPREFTDARGRVPRLERVARRRARSRTRSSTTRRGSGSSELEQLTELAEAVAAAETLDVLGPELVRRSARAARRRRRAPLPPRRRAGPAASAGSPSRPGASSPRRSG